MKSNNNELNGYGRKNRPTGGKISSIFCYIPIKPSNN